MTQSHTPAVTSHTIDPADAQALLHAVDRLPAQALQSGSEPLAPSVRSVLDRFLSVTLRRLLRSLGPVDGPAAVVVDGLTTDGPAIGGVDEVGGLTPRPGLAPAMMAWLVEAAGLFPVVRADHRGARANYQMLWTPTVPPADAAPIRFAEVNRALGQLDPYTRRLVNDRRFRWTVAGGASTGAATSSLVIGQVPIAGLSVDPAEVVGSDGEAEAARLRLIDALAAVKVEIEPLHGRLMHVDRRRGHLQCPDTIKLAGQPEPWSQRVALTADPRADTGPDR